MKALAIFALLFCVSFGAMTLGWLHLYVRRDAEGVYVGARVFRCFVVLGRWS